MKITRGAYSAVLTSFNVWGERETMSERVRARARARARERE